MTTPQTSTKPDTPDQTATDEKTLINQTEKSLANQAPAGEGSPEAYEAFQVPEGYVLDEGVSKEAGGLFKKMNLTQGQAQELVDFYVAKTNEAVTQPYQLWRDMQAEWQKQVKNDPVLGRNLPAVTQSISRAIDVVTKGNPGLAESFRAAMDYTGAGNNPAFIRMFYEMSQMITEGGFVAGKGPSPGGQAKPGETPSAARAMYPNLP